MTIALYTKLTEFTQEEIQDTLSYALRNETEQAKSRSDYFAGICTEFENRYGFSSDVFLERFEVGELGDDEPLFDWYAAVRGLRLWERRHQILGGIIVNG
jgi:hypothetical protein